MLLTLLLLAAPADGPAPCTRKLRPPEQWLSVSDFPRASLRRERVGELRYRLTIGADGCARACYLDIRPKDPKLEERVCAVLLRRARIDPLTDGTRGPITSREGWYRWRLPDLFPPGGTPPRPKTPFESWYTKEDYPRAAIRSGDEGETVFRLDIDALGKVQTCAVQISSGSSLLDTTACNLMRKRAQMEPARTRSGRRVASQWTHTMVWKLPYVEEPQPIATGCHWNCGPVILMPAKPPPWTYIPPLLSLPDPPPPRARSTPRKAQRKR